MWATFVAVISACAVGFAGGTVVVPMVTTSRPVWAPEREPTRSTEAPVRTSAKGTYAAEVLRVHRRRHVRGARASVARPRHHHQGAAARDRRARDEGALPRGAQPGARPRATRLRPFWPRASSPCCASSSTSTAAASSPMRQRPARQDVSQALVGAGRRTRLLRRPPPGLVRLVTR